jgi:hydroxypyruvate isomerase
MPRFAANLAMAHRLNDPDMLFKEVPFLERFKAAARAGFQGVEFMFPYLYAADDLKNRLDENRLKHVLFNLPPGDWDAGERGIAALPGRQSEFREGIDRAIDYAKVLDCPQIHAMAGRVPADAAPEPYREALIENLAFAAARLAEQGIRLLIEPKNTVNVPGYFLNYTAQALEIMDRVASDNLLLCYDVYHAQMMEGNLASTLRANVQRIGHIQIAGAPGRHEPDGGEINYPFLFQVIDSLPYDGWVSCEYHPRGDTLQGLGWARRFGIGG